MTKKEFFKKIILRKSNYDIFELEAKNEAGLKKEIFRRVKFRGIKLLGFEEENEYGSSWGWTIYKTEKNNYIVFEEDFQGGYVSNYKTYIHIFDNLSDLLDYMERYYQFSFNSELYKMGYFEEI